MKRVPLVFAVVFALMALWVHASYSGSMTLMGAGKPGGVTTPFALDGTPVTNNTGSGTTMNCGSSAFSTTLTNDIVYIAMANNGGAPTLPTGGSLTFTQRATRLAGATTITLYSAPAASVLTSVNFTCAQASVDFMTSLVFAFSGAKASPNQFDTNGSIPNSGTAAGTAFTTNNANDILIAAGVHNAAIDSPFTGLSATAVSNFLSVGYNSVSATQSGTTVAFGGDITINTAIDAIVKGP